MFLSFYFVSVFSSAPVIPYNTVYLGSWRVWFSLYRWSCWICTSSELKPPTAPAAVLQTSRLTAESLLHASSSSPPLFCTFASRSLAARDSVNRCKHLQHSTRARWGLCLAAFVQHTVCVCVHSSRASVCKRNCFYCSFTVAVAFIVLIFKAHIVFCPISQSEVVLPLFSECNAHFYVFNAAASSSLGCSFSDKNHFWAFKNMQEPRLYFVQYLFYFRPTGEELLTVRTMNISANLVRNLTFQRRTEEPRLVINTNMEIYDKYLLFFLFKDHIHVFCVQNIQSDNLRYK